MQAEIRRPLLRGSQLVRALWFDCARLGETEARRRLLAAWETGAHAYRVGEGILLAWKEVRRLQCETAPGLPLCDQDGVLASAPLLAQERAGIASGSAVLVLGADLTCTRFARASIPRAGSTCRLFPSAPRWRCRTHPTLDFPAPFPRRRRMCARCWAARCRRPAPSAAHSCAPRRHGRAAARLPCPPKLSAPRACWAASRCGSWRRFRDAVRARSAYRERRRRRLRLRAAGWRRAWRNWRR